MIEQLRRAKNQNMSSFTKETTPTENKGRMRIIFDFVIGKTSKKKIGQKLLFPF